MTERKLTTEELERYLVMAAELVDEYLELQPLLDRFEELYEASKKPPPPKQADRIKAKLAAEKANNEPGGGDPK